MSTARSYGTAGRRIFPRQSQTITKAGKKNPMEISRRVRNSVRWSISGAQPHNIIIDVIFTVVSLSAALLTLIIVFLFRNDLPFRSISFSSPFFSEVVFFFGTVFQKPHLKKNRVFMRLVQQCRSDIFLKRMAVCYALQSARRSTSR